MQRASEPSVSTFEDLVDLCGQPRAGDLHALAPIARPDEGQQHRDGRPVESGVVEVATGADELLAKVDQKLSTLEEDRIDA